jgi:hypothetical protein
MPGSWLRFQHASGQGVELPVIMRFCSFRHLTQAQIEPFSEQDVEQTDPVATRARFSDG